MQRFGQVCDIFNRMSNREEWQGRDIPPSNILQEVKKIFSVTPSSEPDWMNLIALRSSLKSKHCQVLIMCQFNAVGGRVRVKSSNFRAVSALDRRCSWAKVAILLYQYQGSSEVGSQPSSSKDKKTKVKFEGGKEKIATDLKHKLLKELENGMAFLSQTHDGQRNMKRRIQFVLDEISNMQNTSTGFKARQFASEFLQQASEVAHDKWSDFAPAHCRIICNRFNSMLT